MRLIQRDTNNVIIDRVRPVLLCAVLMDSSILRSARQYRVVKKCIVSFKKYLNVDTDFHKIVRFVLWFSGDGYSNESFDLLEHFSMPVMIQENDEMTIQDVNLASLSLNQEINICEQQGLHIVGKNIFVLSNTLSFKPLSIRNEAIYYMSTDSSQAISTFFECVAAEVATQIEAGIS